MSNWSHLSRFARKYYSQCGEEGVLERIFQLIGTTNKVAVEFGCSDGFSLSNTRLFHGQGWAVHMWDACYENAQIKKHLVTAENINDIFALYDIPHSFDLLSIDVDGNDYWVWRALRWQPRVVVIEFNAVLPIGRKCTIPYSPDFKHDGTNYYGASFALLCELGRQKGYVPVCQLMDLNLFFVQQGLVSEPPVVTYTSRQCHPPDPLRRPWQEIEGE